uniref:N-acetyltransferase domain-containing protein n=1 Tax=Ditylum brightwellii TaxID=49249 RepID=A0A7S4VT35_9STRA
MTFLLFICLLQCIILFKQQANNNNPSASLFASSLTIGSSIVGKAKQHVITVPSSQQDYRDVASLLVNIFNEQRQLQRKEEINMLLDFKWNAMGKTLAIREMTSQYIKKGRKMGSSNIKYEVLLVKTNDDSNQVVGMAEMGISAIPSLSSSSSGTGRAVTIGLIAISPDVQNMGLGKALVQKCEDIALNSWNETYVYAAVEPWKVNALSLFTSCGYQRILEEDNSKRDVIISVPVRYRMQTEMRPHLLLGKQIGNADDAVGIFTLKERKEEMSR